MNELQQTELEIFSVFDEVCKTLDIPYFLVCGSALGAIKYQGFIPWDDDLDVGMFREDYERFLKEAQKLLPSHLFLQTAETDPAFPQIYAKLRDSRTTYLETSTAHLPMHHGIFIDLFPLDGYPQGMFPRRILELKKRIYSTILLSAAEFERSARARLFCRILRFFGCHKRTQKTVRRYTRLISRYKPETSKVICNHGNWQGVLEYSAKEHYGNGTRASFEGIRVNVPEQFDAYLTQKYGDWRADLPDEEKTGHHYHTVCDPHRPYTEYGKQKIEKG